MIEMLKEYSPATEYDLRNTILLSMSGLIKSKAAGCMNSFP
jgi:hypothetical protein